MTLARPYVRIGRCLKCNCAVLEPILEEMSIAPSGFTTSDTCECGGQLSSVVKSVRPGTRIGVVRLNGAYWVRTRDGSVDLMAWNGFDDDGLPTPNGTWIPFSGPDYDEPADYVVEVLEGPLKPKEQWEKLL